jgi:hypothetical protein
MRICDFVPYRNSGTNMYVYVHIYIHDVLLIRHSPNAPPYPPTPCAPPPLPASPPSRQGWGVGVGYWGRVEHQKQYRLYVISSDFCFPAVTLIQAKGKNIIGHYHRSDKGPCASKIYVISRVSDRVDVPRRSSLSESLSLHMGLQTLLPSFKLCPTAVVIWWRNAQHSAAMIWNDSAVLENMHIAATFMITQMEECKIFENLAGLWIFCRFIMYSIFSLLRSPLFRRSPHGDLNFDNMLTMYFKIYKTHLQQIQEYHFLRNKTHLRGAPLPRKGPVKLNINQLTHI